MKINSPNTEALKSAIRNVPYRLAIVSFAAVGIGSLAMNYTDNRATVGYTQVCFQPSNPKVLAKAKKQGRQYCTASQRYWISDPILREWETKEPEFYGKLTRLKTIPPSNQYKWVYGSIAMASGLMVAGLGAARLNLINKLAPGYRKEVQALWHRDAVRNGVQMASDAIDGRYAVQRKLALADTEYGRYQAAILTPEELEAMGQQQAYLDAEYQARAIGEREASGVAGTDQAQLPGQSLDEINNPSDKVASQNQAQSQLPHAWTNNLIKQTALIWGNQGGGKSWLARYITALKLKAGYKVVVLDPDSNPSEWVGVESYHSWEDIEKQIRWYVKELQDRLTEFNNSSMNDEQWQAKLLADGRAVTFIVEEATTYSNFIKDEELLSAFGALALTKSRKQLMPITVVAHNNTQACLFGIKNLANLVSKMLQVQCLAEVNQQTLKPQSTGKAKVKLDSSIEWLNVQLPPMKAKVTNFSGITNNKPTTQNTAPNKEDKREYLERVYDMEFEINKPKSTPAFSDNAQIVLEIIQASTKPTIAINAIRSSRKWGDKPVSLETVREAIEELVKAEKITGHEQTGYRALN